MRFSLCNRVGTEVAPIAFGVFPKKSYKNRKKKLYISFFIYICAPFEGKYMLKR